MDLSSKFGARPRPIWAPGSAQALARTERTITSEPLKGTRIPVEVATHVAGTLEFVSGATVSIASPQTRSWRERGGGRSPTSKETPAPSPRREPLS